MYRSMGPSMGGSLGHFDSEVDHHWAISILNKIMENSYGGSKLSLNPWNEGPRSEFQSSTLQHWQETIGFHSQTSRVFLDIVSFHDFLGV